jgi:hypothetical protein
MEAEKMMRIQLAENGGLMAIGGEHKASDFKSGKVKREFEAVFEEVTK